MCTAAVHADTVQYKVVFELFQKLHLQIYASQFMISEVNYSTYICPFVSGKCGKGKNYKNLNISRTKRAF